MKKSIVIGCAAALLVVLPLLAGEEKLGKPVEVKKVTPIADLLAQPEKYVGQDIRIEGEIAQVCQNMGCWIDVKDASSKEVLRVKVNDGEIVFPKEGKGRQVVAQGKFEKIVLTKEQYIASLEHEAEESGKKVDASKITEGKTVYRIKGEGAVLK